MFLVSKDWDKTIILFICIKTFSEWHGQMPNADLDGALVWLNHLIPLERMSSSPINSGIMQV